MNATRSHAPADSFKTPVLILGPGLANRLTRQGLKNIREFTKGKALEKLILALKESPKTATIVILPREEFEKNDTFRHTLTQMRQDFPLCAILALRSGGYEDQAVLDNDKKAGAQDVLWHSSQVPTEADCARIAEFVTKGNLPRPLSATSAQVLSSTPQAKPATAALLPASPVVTSGKTLSTQELLQQVLAGQAVLQAQNLAILKQLKQIHGIASGEMLEKIKALYPKILEALACEER